MQSKRLETFIHNKRRFVCIDLSRIATNAELSAFIDEAKEYMKQFKPMSVYTITDVDNMMYDTKTKELLLDLLVYNTQYVLHSVIIHMDGMKKITFGPMLKASKRNNFTYARTRQQAIDILSQI